MKRKLCAALLCCLLALGSAATALAAGAPQDITARLRPDAAIEIDGLAQVFYSAGGQQVYPLSHDGLLYLPVRAIGELMGKNVNWNEGSLTISLSGSRSGSSAGTAGSLKEPTEVQAQLRPDFTVVVDGATRTFADNKGNALSPALYSGSVYLPLEAVGQLMGRTVSWDEKNKKASLTAPATAPVVTDVDPNQGAAAGGQAPSRSSASGSYIGEEKAKEIALSHAGVNASDANFVRCHLDYDDGRWEYEVEFYLDYTEYDYDIDALSGAILSFDYDAEYYDRPQQSQGGDYIGEAKAKEIALNKAGATSSSAKGMRCYLDYDDGRQEYKVEFYVGTTEYEFEIDAYSGRILEWDADSIYD